MIKKYNKEIGFIYKNENNIDKIYKNNQLVFEQGFTREDSGSTPLTTSHLTTGKNLKGYKVYGNSRQNNLPDGYQEVEWIKSNKDINLGIKTNNNIQIEAKFLRSTTNSQFVYHSDSGSSLSTNTTAYASTNGIWRFGGKSTSIQQSVDVIFETIQNKDGVWFNGEKIGSYTSVPTFTSSSNLCALGSSSSSPNKLYYLKTKDYGANTYSHIWIPCKRTSDNSYGLYDIVGNEFYTNSEATITAGENVTPTPNTPVEIKSVGDLVTDTSDTNYGKYKIPITVSGKNLFWLKDATNVSALNQIYNCSNQTFTKEITNLVGMTYIISNAAFSQICYCEPLQSGKTYIWKFHNAKLLSTGHYLVLTYENETTENWYENTPITLTKNATITAIRQAYRDYTKDETESFQIQVEEGSVATDYEPYYPPVNIYLDEPLRKVGDYADYIDYKEQKVYRNVIVNDDSGEQTIENSYSGTTDTIGTSVALPNIPSLVGITTYNVNTKVQPSNMYIKYKGR